MTRKALTKLMNYSIITLETFYKLTIGWKTYEGSGICRIADKTPKKKKQT